MADFDRIIDRRGTDSLKYDFAVQRGKPADVLPLWVADMDFEGPSCVRDALTDAIKDGIFGYSEAGEAYDRAVKDWFLRRHHWELTEEWLVKTPGVVYALAAAVRALTKEGDAVLIQPPVYYPFFGVVRDNGRRVIENELKLTAGRYEIDFEDFERKICSHQVKLFILCSPHNPVGRVWTREELQRMWEICDRHGVYVVSDEIHCDLIREGFEHITFLRANPEAAGRTVVCTAPSKTFNLAGLQVSNIWIPDPVIRGAFEQAVARTGYSQLNMLGMRAATAAYAGGEAWLQECLSYLEGNLDFIRSFLREELPELTLVEPEGTYFAWIDFSALGLTDAELDSAVTYKAGLWLDPGFIFGTGGSGFERIAYACPRAVLREALERLRRIREGA